MREFMVQIDRAELLRRAVEQLEEADALVQEALGESDATQFTCTQIQDIIADLEADIAELEGR
jgi:hypothetical protein